MANKEPIYVDGLAGALDWVSIASEEELKQHLLDLYGTDRLRYESSLEDVRAEAYRQTRLDFLNPLHPDYHLNKARLEK